MSGYSESPAAHPREEPGRAFNHTGLIILKVENKYIMCLHMHMCVDIHVCIVHMCAGVWRYEDNEDIIFMNYLFFLRQNLSLA